MMRSLYTAATGMRVNQTFVDNVSNNLANVNTVAFKKSKIEFEDLIYQTIMEPGTEKSDGAKKPVGVQVGLGARISATQKMFIQGNLERTDNVTDVAIEGDGFFQIRLPNGEISYTRNGAFKINAEGYISTSQGYLLDPPIVVPDGAQDLSVDASGGVSVVRTSGAAPDEIGQIELARFVNPAGLKAMGENLYSATEASGMPVVASPGEENLGQLRNQFLESSNVQLVEEMVSMIVAQRAYEVSSKAISTSDDMLQVASQLKR